MSIVTFSTAVVVLSGVGSGLILFLAPEESSTYSGGSFVFYPSVGLFLAAVAALLAGLVGCWGATRDSKTALFVFSAAALVVVVAEATSAGVVFAFAYSNQISDQFSDTLTEKVENYSLSDKSSDVAKLQEKYQCCGVHSYEDWRSLNTHWKKEAKEDEVAPRSCCETQFSNNTNCNTIVSELNHEGCVGALLDRLRPVMDAVLGIALIGAILEVVASCMAYHGAAIIRKYEHYDVI